MEHYLSWLLDRKDAHLHDGLDEDGYGPVRATTTRPQAMCEGNMNMEKTIVRAT